MIRARNIIPLALLCLTASGAWAQVWRGPAAIAIEVKGKPQGSVADALVILRYQQMEPPAGPRPVVTDSAGRAVVADLAEGVWEVEVSHDEFLSFVAVVLLENGRKPVVQASFLQASGSSLTPIRVKFADGKGKAPSASVPLPPEAAERLAQRRPLAPPRPPVAETAPAPSPRPTRPPEPVMPEPELRPLPEGARPAEPPAPPPPAEPVAPPEPEPVKPEPAVADQPEPQAPAPRPTAPPEPTAPEEAAPAPPTAPPSPPPTPELEPAAPEPTTPAEPEPVPPAVEPAAPPAAEPPLPIPEPSAPAEPAPPPPTPEPAAPPEPEPAPSMPQPSAPPEPEPAPPAPKPTAPPEPEPAVSPRPAGPEPALEPAPGEPGPPPAPAAPPAPATVLPPPGALGPTLRAYRDRTCIECRPGEFAISVETVVGPASEACGDSLDAAGRELATLLGGSVALELKELAAPAAEALAQMGASASSARVAELLGSDVQACRLVAAVIPKAGRFRGLRMEAADATGVGDCQADRPCPVGRAYWIGQPRVAREPSANVIWGIFVNEAPDRARRARLTVYFAAPNRAWDPPR